MQEFILPDIGEGIVECELLAWLVAEGDTIVEDQPVAEVMTDKATVQIPAMYSGVITKLHYQTGDIAKVHQPLFAMDVSGMNELNSVVHTPTYILSENDDLDTQRPTNMSMQRSGRQHKSLASPAVRRLAKESGIDINLIKGSGNKGRIMKGDVTSNLLEFVTRNASGPLKTAGQLTAESTKMRGLQAAMSKHMAHAWASIPHFTVSDECTVDNLLAIKQTLSAQFAQADIKLTLLPFMVKALSLAMREFPIINASVSQDGEAIEYHSSHHIGIAIDTPKGLIVPNIKDVQALSIYQIAQRIQELVKSAQHNQLSAEDLRGGTVTISNIGPLGGITATPIINHPQVAIVALGKIQRLPRFNEHDEVVGVNIMNINWSGDHRVIDGATMVRFNNAWMQYLTQPVAMLTHLR
ncbi:2-oxo acid dehydrogenase subunit E2 [Glaciecola sp.]|jgi:2-oxoisovalerate dehydrogenase E2 component (dihydrolipoyl transacylase)|nr:2-oxo acid dehydrogenase subunit E2 [Glaciecola sp.]